jgi:hypothetical protein
MKMSDKTEEKLVNLLAGNQAWNIGLEKGAEGEAEVKGLPGNANWNMLCFKDGVIWHPIGQAAASTIRGMLLAFFVGWIARALGVSPDLLAKFGIK